jgi:hypothetical protein
MTDHITEVGRRLRFTIAIGYSAQRPGISTALRDTEGSLARVAGGFTRLDGIRGWVEGLPDNDFSGPHKREASTMFVVSVAGRNVAAWTTDLRAVIAPHARALGCAWVHMEVEEVTALHFRSDAF